MPGTLGSLQALEVPSAVRGWPQRLPEAARQPAPKGHMSSQAHSSVEHTVLS